MADRPLRPARDRSLGEPLPHQQTNLTQAHQTVKASKDRPSFPRRVYAVLIRVSSSYAPVKGRLHTRYSPVRRSPFTEVNAAPRLACIRPAASVLPEPGSNSP